MKAGTDRVVFGHMHEDHSFELSLVDLLPVKRALVIASGGDLAFGLAGAKLDVVAVDSNSSQIDLVRLKMQVPEDLMNLCLCGRVGGLFRRIGPFLGWLFDWPKLRPGRIRVFLLDRIECLLPQVVALVHGPRAGARMNRQAIRLIRRRFEEAMGRPDAKNNPLLQVLLGNGFGLGIPEVWRERGIEKWSGETDRIELRTADIVQVLRDSGDGSLGLISVSNLPDVMDTDAWGRLVEDAARVLVPGGYLVARSMLYESLDSDCNGSFVREENLAGDASPLCPVIWIGRRC